MRILSIFFITACFVLALNACNSSPKETKHEAFCEGNCDTDSVKVKTTGKDRAYVLILLKNCEGDSVTWGNAKMDTYRQLPFGELTGKNMKLNENYVKIDVYESKYAWVTFNECEWGQGYAIKLPFSKTENIFRKNSAINSIDPKFRVHDSLIAYTDRGNIFVEEKSTGKKASMTFGVKTEMEYDNMHATLDSVNITPTRIWAKVKIGKEWKNLEENITLK